MTVETWLHHMQHLQVGDRYRQGCAVCEMTNAMSHLDQGITEDCEFYRRAKKSGKKSLPL